MPKYSNQFVSPDYVEHTIAHTDGTKKGTLRVKPSSVLWKPAGAHTFFSVSLADFENWVSSTAFARKVKF